MSGDSGWNAVIHHPSELELPNWSWDNHDGEPERELPSTVDMGAIKDDGVWNPVTGVTTENSEDDSDSDDDSSGDSDGSCSYSESNSDSDNDSSDSESNSDNSTDHSDQGFSIHENNVDQDGLKLKISAKIRGKDDFEKLRSDRARRLLLRRNKIHTAKNSECSSDDSDSSIGHVSVPLNNHTLRQQQKPLPPASHLAQQSQQSHQQISAQHSSNLLSPSKTVIHQQRTVEPAVQHQSVIQHVSQQPLQELNQEDLAALLPNDQDHSDVAFDGFEDSESGRLVSKAIERMSLSAEESDSSEHIKHRSNAVPVYSSSLLQQFAEKTALLSSEQLAQRKRGRAKQLSKKSSEPEYASSSNVSPDSGIQSVDNSPMHLVGPASPPVIIPPASSIPPNIPIASTETTVIATTDSVKGVTTALRSTSPDVSNTDKVISMSQAATVAAALAAKAKPIVNKDRVAEPPPKRKPGRPAKHQSASQSGTQPRGPGRPPKKDSARNTEPVTKDNHCSKKAKIAVSPFSQEKEIVSKIKGVTQEEKIDRRLKARKSIFNKKDEAISAVSTKQNATKHVDDAKVCLKRKKCLNKPAKQHNSVAAGKRSRETNAAEEPASKRTKREKKTARKGSKKSKSTERIHENTEITESKRSSKESRHKATSPGKRQKSARKTPKHQIIPKPKRVPKENNKSKKKLSESNGDVHSLETNVVGVQTIISLPVINPMKSSDIKKRFPLENGLTGKGGHHHRRHHRHRRRLHAAPKNPVRVDPAVGQQLERLIEEFTKLCSLGRIGTVGPHNNNNEEGNTALAVSTQISELLPQIFHQKKKTCKKRKNDNYSLLNNQHTGKVQKRRCKGQKASSSSSCSSASSTSGASVAGTESSNPNEQRLPLKKRHYHALSVNSNSQERRDDEPGHEDDSHEEEEEEEEDEADDDNDVNNEGESETEAEEKIKQQQQQLQQQKVKEKEQPEKKNEEDKNVASTPKKETIVTPEAKRKQKDEITTAVASPPIAVNAISTPATPDAANSSSANSSISADKTDNEMNATVGDKSDGQTDSQPRRKKKIVKDLRVTVTKIPVENNHVIDKIEKLEKMCAGDKTVKLGSDKSPKSEKTTPEKDFKNNIEKVEKAEIRSVHEHHLRPAKQKQVKETDTVKPAAKKDAEVGKTSVKKDVEPVNKVTKKEVEKELTKKEIDTSNKVPKKDSESGKIPKKDATVGNSPKQSKKEIESVKKDVTKKENESKEPLKKLENKLQDLIRQSEVILHKTVVTCESPALSATSVSTSSSSLTAMIKKKTRRRKAINRTGFPTLKKKKKKAYSAIDSAREDTETPTSDIVEVKEKKTSPKALTVETKKSKLDISKENKEKKKQESPRAKLEVKELSNKKLNDKDEQLSCDNDSVNLQDRIRACLALSRDSDVECDITKPCDKSCPVKYEKIQDSRMHYENATLEESLERYNQTQKIGLLTEENLRKLECANFNVSVKLESHLHVNNNNNRRLRGSASPCPLTVKNLKRLRKEYDTESDALPSSDVASDEQEKPSLNGSSRRRKQPRWRKHYLQAGLFSDYFKEDEPRKSVTSDTTNKNKMAFDLSEHPHGLLPPPYHCGKFLRQRKIPFQLPYDLWWLHTHSRLPGRDLVPSWNYRKIRCNVYYDVKPVTLYEPQACECKAEAGCGDDCINRMVFSECSTQLCPCEDRCKNQRIQKHDWAPGLQRFMTESKGWGVRTQQAIRPGEFILEYVGEVVSEREFKSRMATRYAHDTHHYCLHLDGGLVIDGHRMGGDGRFVNHSCEPNCEMQKWSVNGLPRMALFALRNINAGEELTYDYNFALFNPSEGQECRCGSSGCRGVIGGKSQRVPRVSLATIDQSQNTNSKNTQTERRSVGRPRKNAHKVNNLVPKVQRTTSSTVSIAPNTTNSAINRKSTGLVKRRFGPDGNSLPGLPVFKPLSHQQRCFVQEHQCFLVRNIERMRAGKQFATHNSQQSKATSKVSASSGNGMLVPKDKSSNDGKPSSDVVFTHLTALTNIGSRTVRTRRLAQAQDDPEVNRTAKLAKVLKDLYTVITSTKDETNTLLCSSFMTLPAKRKQSEYYEKVQDPIDLTTIDQNIEAGYYKTPDLFDQDVTRLFDNNIRFFGRTSDIGIAAARLRKLYFVRKPDFVAAITEATGLAPSPAFLPTRGSIAGEEDVIRCICGLHRDEGLMIQCERCLVWQHCDCVKADTSVESYMCERCQPREVDLEIPLENEEEEEGKKYYVTLMRGELQLRTGDTVYVLRDTPDKHTYKTIQKFDYEQMDIFRIERLYKNERGERFVFGHHYLRPHETYHEPTRKFYENEVVCAPLYEAVPCELVAGRCWVLHPHTFCKGRPVGAAPEHIYICEYRVDRAARLFTKVARSRHQICTKPYAFETFPQRIKLYRTYLPHSLDGISLSTKTSKDKKKSVVEPEENNSKVEINDHNKLNNKEQPKPRGKKRLGENVSISNHIHYVHKEKKKKRLNNVLLNLLEKMPNKNEPVDMTKLLDRNRRSRKRPGILNP